MQKKIIIISCLVVVIATFCLALYAAINVRNFKRTANGTYDGSAVKTNQNQNPGNQKEVSSPSIADEKYNTQVFGFNGFSSNGKITVSYDQKTGEQNKKIDLKGSWVFNKDVKNMSFSKDDAALAYVIVNNSSEIEKIIPGKNGAKDTIEKVAFQDLNQISQDDGISVLFADEITPAFGGGIAKKISFIELRK